MRNPIWIAMLPACAFLNEGDLALRQTLNEKADTTADTADTAADTDTDTDTTELVELTVSAEDVTKCDSDDYDDPDLSLSDDGDGVLKISHSKHKARTCAKLEISAVFDVDEVVVTYTDTGGSCDNWCGFKLEYELSGVPSGTWMVDAMGTRESIEVE